MAIVKRIYKTQISYLARVRDPAGKFYPSRNFDTKAEAEEHELELLKRKRLGGRAISKDGRVTTVSQYWDVWSEDAVRRASKGWRVSQDQMFRDYIKPVIGKVYLAEVDKPLIGSLMNRMEQLGRGAQTRRHVYVLLHKLFADAVEYYDMIETNPVKSKFHRPEVIETERLFLKPDQTLRLLDAARASYLGPAAWLGGLTALRVSEIMGLLGEDLFFDEGYIRVARAFNRKTKKMQGYPKQKTAARVPMPPALADYLPVSECRPEGFRRARTERGNARIRHVSRGAEEALRETQSARARDP